MAQWARTNSDTVTSVNSRYDNKTLGLQLSIPLYSGGYVSSTVRQAVATQTRVQEMLEATRRDLGVRVYRIPYTWDAGDCFEVDGACLAWDRKAGPVSGTAWRPGAQVGVTYWRDLGYGLGLVVGTQVELLPAMDTADRANFQCNSLGQCELGQRPSFFGTSLAVSPDLYFGALWDPLRWLGVRVVVTPWSGPHDGPSQWLATQVSLEIRP